MLRHTIVIAFILAFSAMTFGQLKPSLISGEVVSIDAAKIVVAAQTGKFDISLSDKTEYKHMSAEKPSIATATPGVLSDISVGDKVIASVLSSDNGKSLPARTIYLMTKADIAQKQAKETAEWRARGIAGKITAINPESKQITVQM